MSKKLCVQNGVVGFCWLMDQNSHSINDLGCMVMCGLIRIEHTLLIVRYILFMVFIIWNLMMM